MKKVVLFFLLSSKLFAFPTSLYWTICITDVVPTGSVVVGVADYFTLFRRKHHSQILPPDVEATFGVFSWGKWATEAGVDYLGGLDNPWFFNAKARLEENAFASSPALAIGVFNLGTSRRTSFNILYAVAGKTLRDKSRIFLGSYWAHQVRKNPVGYMVGYLKGFCWKKDCEGIEYAKWTVLADYASGKNLLGGGGVGLQYALNSKALFLFGPTWFNDAHFNGTWKWTFQAFFIIPICSSRSSTAITGDH